MRKVSSLFLLVLITSLTVVSCKKPGCRDTRATNFNAEANTEDGTCTYTSKITFWCLPEASATLKNAGHEMLRFEITGVIVDSVVTENFFAPTGECNAPGVKTIEQDLGNYDKRYYKYRVKGNEFVTLYEGFIDLKANECYGIQLVE